MVPAIKYDPKHKYTMEDWFSIQRDIYDIRNEKDIKGLIHIGPTLRESLKNLAFISEHPEEADKRGMSSGFSSLDRFIFGLNPSDLILIAARPGMGKTSFVLSIARNAALDHNRPVALFSLEMSAEQLGQRLFSMESGIPTEHIAKGQLNDQEWTKLMDSIGPLQSSNLIIDDTPALSVFDLRAKCRRLKHKHNIQMVIIDYLQLMRGDNDNSNKGGNREQEISHISRSLKALAKELDIPVIALAQLSRAVEIRGGSKRPQLSDLRESGSIEQDADMVLFIYRPEYYHLDTFDDNEQTPSQGLADIMFEKNRHGSTGNVRVSFEKQYTRFSDVKVGYYTKSQTTFTEDDNASSSQDAIRPSQKFNFYESSFNDEPTPDDSAFNGDMPF